MGTIESYETAKGKRYRVRYRTPHHRQTDKRGFRAKRDAEDFLNSVASWSRGTGPHHERSTNEVSEL